jgi:hypothetical protein
MLQQCAGYPDLQETALEKCPPLSWLRIESPTIGPQPVTFFQPVTLFHITDRCNHGFAVSCNCLRGPARGLVGGAVSKSALVFGDEQPLGRDYLPTRVLVEHRCISFAGRNVRRQRLIGPRNLGNRSLFQHDQHYILRTSIPQALDSVEQ